MQYAVNTADLEIFGFFYSVDFTEIICYYKIFCKNGSLMKRNKQNFAGG